MAGGALRTLQNMDLSRRNVMEKGEEGDKIREKEERDLHADKTMKSLRLRSN